MKKLSHVIMLVGLMLVSIFSANLLSPTSIYPAMSIRSDDGITVNFLQNATYSHEKCVSQLDAMSDATRSSCPNCKFINKTCLTELTDQQKKWLSHEAIEYPSAVSPRGVVVYVSDTPHDAQAACLVTEKISKSHAYMMRTRCFGEGEPRSTPEQIIPGNYLTHATSFFFVLFGSLILIAILTGKMIAKQGKQPANLAEKTVLASTDALVVLLPFVFINQGSVLTSHALLIHLALVSMMVAWYWLFEEHYTRRRPFWDELRQIFRTQSVVFLLATTVYFYAGDEVEQAGAVALWLCAFGLIPIGRACSRDLMKIAGIWLRKAVIIGTGENAREALLATRSESNLGYDIIGFVRPEHQSDNAKSIKINQKTYPVIPFSSDIKTELENLGNPKVIVGLDSLSPKENLRLIRKLAIAQNDVHIIPTIRGLPLFGTELSHFFSHEVVFLTIRNNLARKGYRLIKRGFDLTVASLMVILLSPLLVTLTVMIRRTGGSAFYGHPRIGQDGQMFKCLKFRSMRPDADKVLKELLASDPNARAEWDKDFKLKNDPRITPVGHFIRKTSLDELPQLFNVIRGEMSLVGPRPVVKDELERYGESASFYLEAKPGITGLWQVSGRNDTTYAERVSLDSWYVQNWSLWYDIAILFKTVDVVLNRRGAY